MKQKRRRAALLAVTALLLELVSSPVLAHDHHEHHELQKQPSPISQTFGADYDDAANAAYIHNALAEARNNSHYQAAEPMHHHHGEGMTSVNEVSMRSRSTWLSNLADFSRLCVRTHATLCTSDKRSLILAFSRICFIAVLLTKEHAETSLILIQTPPFLSRLNTFSAMDPYRHHTILWTSATQTMPSWSPNMVRIAD